jgi:hypothetical protein
VAYRRSGAARKFSKFDGINSDDFILYFIRKNVSLAIEVEIRICKNLIDLFAGKIIGNT